MIKITKQKSDNSKIALYIALIAGFTAALCAGSIYNLLAYGLGFEIGVPGTMEANELINYNYTINTDVGTSGFNIEIPGLEGEQAYYSYNHDMGKWVFVNIIP